MWEFPSGTLRYRMTVQVEADGQMYEASAVHQVRYSTNLPILPGNRFSRNFDGEAIALDVGDRGTLFVLLTGVRCCADEPFSMDNGYNGVKSFASVIFDRPGLRPEVIRSLSSFEQRVDVPFNRLPMMVLFRDLGDPLSIELVNPYDLAASFGEDVSLRGVRLETTRDRVTAGLEERFSWISDLRGSIRRDLPIGDPLGRVTNGSFIMGIREWWWFVPAAF